MSNLPIIRRCTGEVCDTAGHYIFELYLDRSAYPRPQPDERVIKLKRGDIFPPITSKNLNCWLRLSARA